MSKSSYALVRMAQWLRLEGKEMKGRSCSTSVVRVLISRVGSVLPESETDPKTLRKTILIPSPTRFAAWFDRKDQEDLVVILLRSH